MRPTCAPPASDDATMNRGFGPSVSLLSLAAFASSASMRLNDAMLPRLAGEFHVDLGAAAQVSSVFAVAYGLALLCFGPLGERFGKFRFIAWACMASALASALCAVATGLQSLLWMRALAGAAAAAIIPLSMAWIGDVYPYEGRQHVLARFLIGQIVGLAAGVWLGGLAADYLSWRAPYGLLAVHYAAVGVVLLRLDRQLPAHARARRRAGESALRGMWTGFGHVLKARWARVILVCVLLEGLLLYGPFTFIASHLHRQVDLALSMAGAVVMLFALGGLAFAVASPRLVRRLGEVGLAGCGGTLLCAAWLLVAWAPAWEEVAIGIGVAGIGF